MKKTIYSLSLLLCLSLCVPSCGDDKKYTDEERLDKITSKTRNVNFAGKIDGIYYNAKAQGDTLAGYICKIDTKGNLIDSGSPSFLIGEVVKIQYAQGDSLCLKLWPVISGWWDLADKSIPQKNTQSDVWVVNGGKEYRVLTGRGKLVLSINKVLQSGLQMPPLAYGDLYGTLYNTKDPNDSIALDISHFRL